MEERALPAEVRLSMLRSVVPFGFINVIGLAIAPVVLALVADDRVAPGDLRRWVAAVWIGGLLQLGMLLSRRKALERSPQRWERLFGWVAAFVGATWGVALAIDVIDGRVLEFQLIVMCFLLMNSAAAAVAFAGSPHIGRRFLGGLWLSASVIAAKQGAAEVIGLATLVWPMALTMLAFATRLLRLSAVEHHRSRELSRDLAIQASTDGLTGLLNRRATLQRIQQTMDAGHGVTALFVDLDGFKRINDRHGHATGDTVLINVAERLVEVARADDIVGRLGGDEFIVVLTEPADQHLADLIASRYAGEIARCHGAIHELAVTASVGAARSVDGATAEDLLGCADAAMYRAKAQGGNTAVHFLEPHFD